MEEIPPEDAGDAETFDPFIWPFCFDLKEAGAGWLAPDVPGPVLVAALLNYLDLADDETLLAILGDATNPEVVSDRSCALTTKRIYWLGGPRRADAEWADPEHPSATAGAPPPRRCEYLAYKELSERIGRGGFLTKVVDLGEGRTINPGSDIELTDTLIAFLRGARARVRGEMPPPVLTPALEAHVRWNWPAAVAANARARRLQAELRWHAAVIAPASPPFVTYALVAACFLVVALMLLRGVNIFEPKNEAMYAWGAIFGPAVVFQGQLWRLPASMFLHFGLMHLAMNMWCLVSTGPVVERFFGHLGFAALYLIAGLGGAIASLVVHPTGLCAGASGAIFGVFGALLAFLAVRHRDVPAAILEPMRSGTLAFLGYNVVFGLMNKNIDMAGHLGGLATGFVAGLFLAGGWVTRNDGVGLLRRIGMIGALSAGLFPLARSGFGHAEGSILADPTMGPLLLAAPSWNEFVKELPPVLREFDRIGGEIDGIVNQLSRSELPVQRLEPAVNRLIADSDALGRRIAALPTRNAEIEAMRARLASARTNQGKALNFLKRFVAEGDPRIFNEKDGMKAVSDALKKDVEQFSALRAAYFKAHGLTEHALP